MSSGTITLRRPRVRGVEERFESRVLPLFARRTKELGALLPQLYLHGLAEGDFELAMRGLPPCCYRRGLGCLTNVLIGTRGRNPDPTRIQGREKKK